MAASPSAGTTANNADGRGKNATQLRRYNERLVLKVLRRMGEATRADIARNARLTSAAVGRIVDSLEEQGLVILGERQHEGQRGQPARMVSLNCQGSFSIGVRLDRSCIETVLIDFDGNMLFRMGHSGLLGRPQDTLEIVQRDIHRALEFLGSDRVDRLAGIGLAMPFNLDCWTEELHLPADHFRTWSNFDFPAALQATTDIPVFAENDGTSACIAELFYGVGRQLDDFLYLFFGPGIGGGIVLGGDIHRGVNGNAGDVGLMLCPPSTLPSAFRRYANRDILLNRASINTLQRHLSYCGVQVHTRTDLEAAVNSGHPAVLEWSEDCADALELVIWSCKSLLDIPAVVLDADVSGEFLPLIRSRMGEMLVTNAPEARTPPDLIVGSFGSDAGAIGAASLPIFYSFSPGTSAFANTVQSREE